jgi:hypothetical protein
LEKEALEDEKDYEEKDSVILVRLMRTGWSEAGRVNQPVTLPIR